MTQCIMTHSTFGCGGDAVCYEQFGKNTEGKKLFYCKKHREEGIEWGWLDKEDLVELKDDA